MKRERENKMENKSTTSGQGNFFNGFLLGLLVGGFIVFLLGTKKGKRILKEISENGLDNISDALNKKEESPIVEKVTKKVNKIPRDEYVQERKFAVSENIDERPKARRFFRGISRRLN